MIKNWHGLQLTIPKKHREQFAMMEDLDRNQSFRYVSTYRHLGNLVLVLVIFTKGYGARETFKGAKLLRADFGSIGQHYSIAYVREGNEGKIKRILNDSPRVMVSRELDDDTINKFNALFIN